MEEKDRIFAILRQAIDEIQRQAISIENEILARAHWYAFLRRSL